MSNSAKPNQSLVPVFELRVQLLDFEPAIWRRFVIAREASFFELHLALQRIMGWGREHLHTFQAGKRTISDPEFAFRDDELDENVTRLDAIFKRKKQRVIYVYDLGDNWRHEVVLVDRPPDEPADQLPRCLDGANACPPEDIGGVWGYATFLKAVADPDHPSHEWYTEWVDPEFDATAFDVDAVN